MIGALWRGLTGALRALFGTVVGLLLVATLTLNLSMVAVPAVFNAVSGMVWSAVSMIDSATVARRATQARTAAALRADADDLAQARARVDTVEADNRRLTSQRRQALRRATRAEQELDRTRSHLASTESELQTTRTRAASAEAELQTTRTRAASAEAELQSTRARAATAEAESRRLISQRGQALSRATRAEQELDRTRTRLASAESELQTTRTRAASAEAENRRLTTEQRRAQTQLATAQADTHAARLQIAAVEADNTRLRTSANAVEARLEAMSAQRVRAQSDARTITGRMQTRSVRMVTRNTSAAMVEAIPFIGGVAVVATLAWDVYDTCAQIGDLQALQATLNLGDSPPSEVEDQWCGLSFEELFSRLAGTASPSERACASARVRTQTLDPPECSDFPLELPGYSDPLDGSPLSPVLLPDYTYD
ncbi:hypothetical protein HUK65_17255 [Rhodobacteraceae bacterium 2376]|uniref:Uncharacterized protein n=1 Tax=Rhabdonatronobacter sediminivivens TaxID=2743469 RepID=A0A7Z0I2E8_9RHOB|nr:hypothetical protein [Rhabdonatronobacter sediminivivens]NYS26727.1 hypothetical protein [Rhabdonatronobacter sediminivivens]